MSEEPDTTEETETEPVETEAAAAEPTETEAAAAEPTEAPEEAATEPEVPAEPAEALTPKQRRARARSAKAAARPTRDSRTPEERHAERVETRARKAAARRTERQRARAKEKAQPHSREATAPREHAPGVQKTRQGVVVSDKADKTITVRIDVARRHRRYQKIVRTSRTLHAHDERNDANVGDTVIVREARPLSRTKRWRLVQVVERAK
jgi:small subunit ribosomal protein S17